MTVETPKAFQAMQRLLDLFRSGVIGPTGHGPRMIDFGNIGVNRRTPEQVGEKIHLAAARRAERNLKRRIAAVDSAMGHIRARAEHTQRVELQRLDIAEDRMLYLPTKRDGASWRQRRRAIGLNHTTVAAWYSTVLAEYAAVPELSV